MEGEQAKIDPAILNEQLYRKVGDVHSTQPSPQATGTGNLYSLADGQLCAEAGVKLHMDGARSRY